MDGRPDDLSPGQRIRYDVPDRLERARKEAGFETLKEFHQALTEQGSWYEISYPTVLNYHGRSERSEPTLSYLTRVAEVTEVRLEWLVTGEGDMFPDYTTRRAERAEAGSDFVATIKESLDRSRRADPEGFERAVGRVVVLPGRFVDRLPFISKLSPSATTYLRELSSGLLSASAHGDETGLWVDDMDRFADDVGKLMRLPYEKFGLQEDPSSFRYNQYVMGLVQALMLVSPKREEDIEVRSYPIKSEVLT